MSQEKTIRFIDTNYRTLFTLPDGGNLRMTFPDGRSKVSRCRYVDEYHTEVAGRVYHICEFAGHMERGGIACAPEEPLPRQTDKQAFQERRFHRAPFGAYAIYQLRREEATHNLRFEPLEHLRAAGLAVDRTNYDLVYTGALPSRPDLSREALLESLYERFNLDPPRDFTGHSLSVSDVVGLKGKSGVSFHYVDSFGFAELPAFLPVPDRVMEEASHAAELAEQPFALVSFREKPALLADWRVDRSLLPQGIYAYDLRYGEEWGVPVTLENQARVNFCGTLLFNEPLTLSPDGRITLDRDAIDHLDGKAISLSEFQKQQALQRRPPLLKRLRAPRPAQTERKPAKAEQER